MFVRLLVVVIVVGLLLGAAISVGARSANLSIPGAAAAQQSKQQQTDVQTYTGDRAPGSGGFGGAGAFGPGAGGTAPTGPVKVAVNDQTTVLKPAAAALADLKSGDNISVQGQPGTDGTILAKSITLTPQGQGGRAGQGNQQGNRPVTGSIDQINGSVLTVTPRQQGQGQQGQTQQGQGQQGTNQQGGTRGQQGQGQQGQGQQGQGQQGQGQQGGGNRGGFAFGTIDKIDANTITVQNSFNNTSVKVQVDDSTTYTKMEQGTQADLTTGLNVTVVGQAGSDGTVAATIITIAPATNR